jgi:hypothetical protein
VTEILKQAIPSLVGVSNAKPTIEKLREVVDMLQGATDQDQRAVRMFEFEQAVADLDARLKTAGF